MFLVSILATMALITLATAASLSYPMYKRREPINSKYMLLSNQRGPGPELQNEMLDSENDLNLNVVRNKRLGSLSIVNSLDVLRDRVMLELARRKAQQDQRQIAENRLFLENVGKRSISDYNEKYSPISDMESNNDVYAIHQRKNDRDQSVISEKVRVPSRIRLFQTEDDPNVTPDDDDGDDDDVQRLQSNGVHLL